jgi:circadian clock protein KaiB
LNKVENEDQIKLVLFITGASTNSIRAVNNLKAICNQYLKDNFTLEVVDVYLRPEIAQREQIIALPTLVKKYPSPERRFVGDLSDTEKVLKGFGIELDK